MKLWLRGVFSSRVFLPGTAEAAQKGVLKELSPSEYLGPKSPPLLLVQGDQHTGVPLRHALHLEKRAKAVHAPLELIIVKNAGHNWRQVGPTAIEPSLEDIEKKTAEFVVRAGKTSHP